MKKLSKTQSELLNNLISTIEVCKKYTNYEDMFLNSKNEQNHLPTKDRCNCYYQTKESFSAETWACYEEAFNDIKYKNTLIVYAKTETLKALENHGDIIIIEHAKYKGDAELVKVIY